MLAELKNVLVLLTEDTAPGPAVARALRLAEASDATVTLLDVGSTVPAEAELTIPRDTLETLRSASEEQRRSRLDTLADRIRQAGVAAHAKLATGDPYRVAIHHVLTDRHDLVLKTVDAQDPRARSTLGSTDKHLLRKCPCPVWLVREDEHLHYKTILAAVEPNPSEIERHALSVGILRAAAEIAAVDHGSLHVLHAWHVFGEIWLSGPEPLVPDAETDDIVGRTLNRHARMLDELIEQSSGAGVPVDSHLVHQHAGPAIIDFVARYEVDLLVIGSVGRSGVAGLLIGNTAEHVLSEVTCSVLCFAGQARRPHGGDQVMLAL